MSDDEKSEAADEAVEDLSPEQAEERRARIRRANAMIQHVILSDDDD